MSEFDRLMNTHVRIRAQVPISSMVTELDEADTVALIRALDLSQQDADFTIKVIKELWKSLLVDMGPEEMVKFSKELKRIAKGKESE